MDIITDVSRQLTASVFRFKAHKTLRVKTHIQRRGAASSVWFNSWKQIDRFVSTNWITSCWPLRSAPFRCMCVFTLRWQFVPPYRPLQSPHDAVRNPRIGLPSIILCDLKKSVFLVGILVHVCLRTRAVGRRRRRRREEAIAKMFVSLFHVREDITDGLEKKRC